MKNIILILAFLVLLAVDLMALETINNSSQNYALFGWLVLLFSTVIYAIFALKTLEKK